MRCKAGISWRLLSNTIYEYTPLACFTRDEARRISANIANLPEVAAALTTSARYKPLGQLTQINAARRAHPKL